MTHVILDKMSDDGIWNPDDDPRAFPDDEVRCHLSQEAMKAWLTNHKLDDIVWEVLPAFNLGQQFERDVHYTSEYYRDGVMNILSLYYAQIDGPVRDYVSAISGIAINQTRKDVYMDQIYRVSDWGPGPKALHDKAKAIYEDHVSGRRGRPGRDESWGSHGWQRGRGGSYRRDQSGGSDTWTRPRERTRSAPPARVELTARPPVRLTPVDDRRPRTPPRRSYDVRGDTAPSYTIIPSGDGGYTRSWAGARRWSRTPEPRTVSSATQTASSPPPSERRRPSRTPGQQPDGRSRSPHDRQVATQQAASSSDAAWGSAYGGYTEEEWVQWRHEQWLWWRFQGWRNWWRW